MSTGTIDDHLAHPGGEPLGAAAVVPALPYHRLAHLTPQASRWWRPLLVLLVGALLTGAVLLLTAAVAVLVGLIPGVPAPTEQLEDPRNPSDVAFSFGTIAAFLPVAVLACRWAGARRGRAAGTLHSVAGRFRWELAARSAAVVIPAFVLVNLVPNLLWPPDDFSAPTAGPQLVAVYVAAVVLVPLQCAAEEYVFRGLPQQLLGTWLRSPWWGVVLPVPLFMAGHGYDWVGQIDIATFALCMGYLTWKTGGLELPIVIHLANNLTLTMLAPFIPSSMQQGETDPLSLVFSVPIVLVVTVGLSVWVSRREGLTRWEPLRGRGRAAGEPAADLDGWR